MEKKEYASMFETEDSKFTGEEITNFKKYIEENSIRSDNSFEFFEENLTYFSLRHTSPNFYSPSRFFHTNSNFIISDEMEKNLKLYKKSIEWAKETIHPEDSEYVIKQEKYRFINELSVEIEGLIEHLNTFALEDYQCIDILIYKGDAIYQYLPGKNFIFTWRKNCREKIELLYENQFFQNEESFDKISNDEMIIVPIFIPVRECLFLGEFGYRDALITYGQLIERMYSYLKKSKNVVLLRYFDNLEVHKIFNIDGIDKSILNLLVISEI
ncbi:hypothetical protein [Candidatus Enterococcus courvalinii]|uniref:Uncharacterized protein n=1 Tax=Candidatus Enterococcus courvalinii TaxID=2815329 RepID=A0ABS3HXS9_9ENTE|nr:hypothetical protein [Enterococcus sp. MSG2901]MBO0481265.1 hypothetical protein [Enterococcus sp. MSG2901]